MIAMSKPKPEIGIYGGTFAPPHCGHLHAIRAFLRELNPDRLYVIPARIPPHKAISPVDNPQLRLEMLRAALQDEPEYGRRLQISDLELRSPPPSYTVRTLEYFASQGSLTFLCGTDMFLTLPSWHEAERIFQLTRIALLGRYAPTEAEEQEIQAHMDLYCHTYGANIVRLQTPPLPMNSTDIRTAVMQGGSLDHMVPPAVAKLIRQYHLYQEKDRDTP